MRRFRSLSDDFNPRSREGSDLAHGVVVIFRCDISIHAPARGATRFPKLSRNQAAISIHAPARGATLRRQRILIPRCHFNPRSREGSDFPQVAPGYYFPHISIHAPARGATLPVFQLFGRSLISIHAPARGATSLLPLVGLLLSHFNPRSREGSDALFPCPSTRQQYFNPRSREGSDQRPVAYKRCYFISIHAPARGATKTKKKAEKVFDISIHAPARGATISILINVFFNGISIHAPARGATIYGPHYRDDVYISIHAPARGATAILSKIHPMFLTISHNASSFSSFPFHSFLPHLLNSSTFCALFQVRISRAFSMYYRFAPKKSTPDLQLYHVLHRYVQL